MPDGILQPSSPIPAEPGDGPSAGETRLLVTGLSRAGVRVSTNPQTLAAAGTDWTGSVRGRALAVATPTDAAQVAMCLHVAAKGGIPVQVQGGNTGLVGGSVPEPGHPALVLSTRGLRALGPVAVADRSVLVGAGVTCAEVSAAAAARGLRFGVDLAARDSASIGGMVATNAGGIRVCAYGMMRQQVRGLVTVLADGSVLDSTARPRKDNTGYDLTGLLVGSEGTLGVVVAAELALHPTPPASSVALLGVADLATAVTLARSVAGTGHQLLAAEAVDGAGMVLVSQQFGLRAPGPPAPWWLLLEVADGATGAGLEPLAEFDPIVATEPGDASALWALRERQTLAYSALGQPLAKFDVSVQPDRLDALVGNVAAALAECVGVAGHGVFGHMLDGNLHFEVWGRGARDPEVTAAVLRAVAGLAGSVSAEHGIGRVKAPYLHLSRGPAHIAAMAAIREALDPGGLLNRGVLLPPGPATAA